jgi:hypothetical protein
MARKLKATHVHPETGKTAKVYRDAEWQEWVVEFFIAGVKKEGASYHTDDRADAEGTALAEIARPVPVA